MTYFRVLNIDTNAEFFVASTLSNETAFHLAASMHLGESGGRYDIKEISKDEFERKSNQ